uniref:Yip1 family protein n=1 Tax=Metallibacterium sp. TaxID=2940281 RepID=UPI002607B479
MPFQSIIERARGILLAPRETWPAIAAEPVSASAVFSGWVLWFAAIGPLARLIGWTAFGSWTPFLGNMHVAFAYSLAQAVLTYVLALAMVLIMAFIVDLLAASFGGTRNFSQALKTVAYAYTPAWIVAVLGLVPALGMLLAVTGLLAAGYSIYLLYVGLPFTMKCPQDRSAAYAAVSVVIAVILSVVL